MKINKNDLPLFGHFINEVAEKTVKLNVCVPVPNDLKFFFSAFYKPMIDAIDESKTEMKRKTFYK